MSLWQRLKERLIPGGKKLDTYPDGTTPGEKDTITAIRELSQAIMENPDTVETYLALGNLYRARGDIERAVKIRESLLIRSDLPQSVKGRIYFELGQDFRRAGLMDRAYNAYMEADRLGVAEKLINTELAFLYSSTGNWEKACEYYYAIGNEAAEAHFMTRQGAEIIQEDPRELKKAMRIFNKALKIYPGSVEAWAAMITQYALADKWGAAAKALSRALESISTVKAFLLFEEVMLIKPAESEDKLNSSYQAAQAVFYSKMADSFVPVLAARPPEIFPNFYSSMLLKRAGRLEEAEQWMDKTLVMQPDFWYGRLTHLALARQQHTLPPLLDTDLDFFISQSEHVKRFVCSACGLNRDQLFYVCQRCNSWHSATYKFTLND